MKVTVIVPVYNAENYIEACMESILCQSYRNLEILMIDDGSTDGTGELLKQFIERDNRIQVIRKENEGQSIARNLGLNLATGEYIFFADADDLLPPDAVEALVKEVNKCTYDVVCGSYIRVETNHKEKRVSNPMGSGIVSRYNKNELRRYHAMKTKSIFGYVWGKLYRLSFLKEHQLSFDDIREIYMEDTLFNLKLFCHQPAYYYTDAIVYRYHVRETSTSRRRDGEITDKLLAMLKNYKEYLQLEQCYGENLELYLPLAMRVFCWALMKESLNNPHVLKGIYRTILTFANNQEMKEAVNDRGAITSIGKVTGIFEKIFFLICLLCLRRRYNRLLSVLFYLLHPVSLVYIKISVK